MLHSTTGKLLHEAGNITYFPGKLIPRERFQPSARLIKMLMKAILYQITGTLTCFYLRIMSMK